MVEELIESVKENDRRRRLQPTGLGDGKPAEVAIKYCQGQPRRAEVVFGWGRDAVNTG